MYETFDLVKKFFDPGFRINKAVAQLIIEVARRLIDDPILPLNCIDYGEKLKEDKDAMIKVVGPLLTKNGIDIGKMLITRRSNYRPNKLAIVCHCWGTKMAFVMRVSDISNQQMVVALGNPFQRRKIRNTITLTGAIENCCNETQQRSL